MSPTYYLDTTIQLSKLFAPASVRQTIHQRIQEHSCVASSYARMEYLRWLEPCVAMHQLLQEEIAHNRTTALSEVQARILLAHGRNQNKMLSIMTWLLRAYSPDARVLLVYLKTLIEYEFHEIFTQGIELLPDPIACPLMDLRAIPETAGYRLEPNLAYRRGAMPCHIVDFLQGHRRALQELSTALRETYPQMAEACGRVLENPTDAQGNTCKTLGDVIIALQTPADAVLWTTDASFDLICPVIGIPHLRERLIGEGSQRK
ncbi:MAG: hypothetical protein DYG89_34075 [Caldilinea sp. CFX5]|nr:hypothetical protein [Caldilinea sp. CFX5]